MIMLVEYIRNKKNEKIGVLVATNKNDSVHIGYSLCNKKDKFDKVFGKNMAINRTTSNDIVINYDTTDEIYQKLPYKLLQDHRKYCNVSNLENFVDRCSRYFKCKKIFIHIPKSNPNCVIFLDKNNKEKIQNFITFLQSLL